MKRRFVAPPRDALDATAFDHPIFDRFASYRTWLTSQSWPALDHLNAAMSPGGKRFVLQDQALLQDGLHYEARIAERGAIATRPENWHDLFNAMVWCRYPSIKLAINRLQVAHIATMGTAQRNRAQYALTQFDEAGAIVCVRDPALLALWDRHAWRELFHENATAWWSGDIRIAAVIGHALLEHALAPELLLVGKCLVVQSQADDDACIDAVAEAMLRGEVLNDPQELRPLPLAGIPGWHCSQDATFFAEAEYFRPLKAERRYPLALMLA